MDEENIGAADCPPTHGFSPTGGDRATEELLKVPPITYTTDTKADETALATHAHLSLVTRLAGSEH